MLDHERNVRYHGRIDDQYAVGGQHDKVSRRELATALERFSVSQDLVPALEEIHRLENEGDAITRHALQKLFDLNHQTAADLIKWKDLYALLEATLDECESAAEILESISIKKA